MAIKELEFDDKQFEISYEILNPKKQTNILILHGWGANKELMKQAFGVYFGDFRHIYIDLPGFGKSTNEYVLTTSDYFEIIKEFLKSIEMSVDAVIGHSFGGKVATLLNPKNLILLSSSGIPQGKSTKVKTKIVLAKILRPILGDGLVEYFKSDDAKGMPKNMYETFKNVVDEDFSEQFSKATSKTLIFWGKNDTATPINSGQKIHGLVKNSKFYELDGDHYFFLHHAREIYEICKMEIL